MCRSGDACSHGPGSDASATYYCEYVDRQIAPSTQKVCMVVSLVGILVFLIVSSFGVDIFCESWVAEEPLASFNLPTWVAELPVPLGFLLLFAQAGELKALWGNDAVSLGVVTNDDPSYCRLPFQSSFNRRPSCFRSRGVSALALFLGGFSP